MEQEQFTDIVLDVRLDDFKRPKGKMALAMFVFDEAGGFVGKEPLYEGDAPGHYRAMLSFADPVERVRVLVGPDVVTPTDARLMERLEKLSAYGRSITVTRGGSVDLRFEVPEFDWLCWVYTKYVVKGRVVRQVDGQERPVCVGEVGIYEVDSWFWCLRKLEPRVITWLKDAIIREIIDPPIILPGDDGDDGWCGSVPPKPGPFPPARGVEEFVRLLKNKLAERFPGLGDWGGPGGQEGMEPEVVRLGEGGMEEVGRRNTEDLSHGVPVSGAVGRLPAIGMPGQPLHGAFEDMERVVLEVMEELPDDLRYIRERYVGIRHARSQLQEHMASMGVLERRQFLASEVVPGLRVSDIVYSDTRGFVDLLYKHRSKLWSLLCWPWILPIWWWCWHWPWHWQWHRSLIGKATLDSDGTFYYEFWRPACDPDQPDLWFDVTQRIDGHDTVIYGRYPVPCHTFWNHPSGAPVELRVSHPKAIVCWSNGEVTEDPNERWVAILSVGGYSLKGIYGAGAGNDASKVGLYNLVTSDGHVFEDGPFGGTVGLNILFSPALANITPHPVRYYRVEYRVGSGEWHPVTHTEYRHYTHVDPVTGTLSFPAYALGPKTVGGEQWLYEIPPKEPPNLAVYPDAQWMAVSSNDLIAARLNTAEFDGPIDFKLELFDDQGNRVDPAGMGIAFKIPNVMDLSQTVTMEDAQVVNPDLVVPDPEAHTYTVFMLRLRVENRPASALISQPQLEPGNQVVDSCGFLQYDPAQLDAKVRMSFQAKQDGGFAIYQFRVDRANQWVTGEPASQSAPPNSLAVGQSSAYHEVEATVATLLGGNCHHGVFQEDLYLWHKAFDGWRRLRSLDAHQELVFALKPESSD